MGRKQNRKRSRRMRARVEVFDFALPPMNDEPWAALAGDAEDEDVDDLFAVFTGRPSPTNVKACGNCRDFIEDGEFGRGTCVHPGSGVLSPWDNTPACEFHTPRRR